MSGARSIWPALRKLCGVLCLLMAFWFFLPIPLLIFSIACVVGAAGFGLAGLVLLRWERFCRWLKKLWKKRGMRVILTVLAVVLAALVVLTGVLSARVVGGMHQPESDADTVIVLGCQVRGDRPSRLLARRINAAADYLNAHPQAMCIVSGGQGSGENITEAECMYRGLVQRGVAAERILLEPDSTSTRENLAFSRKIMEAQGLQEPVLVVSNNFHIYRALQMASESGLEARGLPAACDWFVLPTYILREAMALVKYRIFG